MGKNEVKTEEIPEYTRYLTLAVAVACMAIIGLGSAQIWYIKGLSEMVQTAATDRPPVQGNSRSGNLPSETPVGSDNVSLSFHQCQGGDCCPTALPERRLEKCYGIVPFRFTQADAAGVCHLLYPGAHLLEINSGDEQREIVSLLRVNYTKQVWTAGVWVGPSTDDFVSSHSNATVLYTNWARNEPDGRGCVLMYKKPNWKWYDERCDKQHPFICEFP